MSTFRREKAMKLKEKFFGKWIVRTDGLQDEPVQIRGFTPEGALIIYNDLEPFFWVCPLGFTGDNWEEYKPNNPNS